jgi:hypothetical protein
MTYVSSFEVLAQNLVPADIVKPGPENPFLIQGYFLQVSCVAPSTVANFNLIFQETTDFTQGLNQKSLQAQVIDANGKVDLVPNSVFFGSTGRGFLGQTISTGQTLIFGVQCLPQLVGADEDASLLPQAGTGWRGTVRLENAPQGSLIATATQRLVYYAGTSAGTGPVSTACVYAVPTASGGTAL